MESNDHLINWMNATSLPFSGEWVDHQWDAQCNWQAMRVRAGFRMQFRSYSLHQYYTELQLNGFVAISYIQRHLIHEFLIMSIEVKAKEVIMHAKSVNCELDHIPLFPLVATTLSLTATLAIPTMTPMATPTPTPTLQPTVEYVEYLSVLLPLTILLCGCIMCGIVCCCCYAQQIRLRRRMNNMQAMPGKP